MSECGSNNNNPVPASCDNVRQHADHRIEALHSDIKEIKDAVVGNFEKPGILGRLRTLEKTQERRTWYLRALSAAFIAATVRHFFTK